jgi:hypothetical protein
MKILLINPAPSGTLKATGVLFPPLGLLYIGAYMEREGHQVEGRDYDVRKKGEAIDFKGYDLVGISTDTTRYRQKGFRIFFAISKNIGWASERSSVF